MIAFPVLKHLRIQGYPLYPGPDGDQVMELALDQGPWIILGVNGLGKSTLLLMLRYLLSGAVRIRDAGFAGEREDLMQSNNRFFAVRVTGGAQDAKAIITAEIGSASLTVERRLENLALERAEVTEAGKTTTVHSEAEYRVIITRLMHLTRFEDAVRIFDFVTFFLETRQPLIWNLAAQFELFRAIVTPENSPELRRLEGAIVSADSLARNLNASLFSIQKRRDVEARKKINVGSTIAKLAATQAAYDEAVSSEMKTQSRIEELDEEADDAFLQVKRSEKTVDDCTREYELIKYNALKDAFEGIPLTEQYLFLKLLSDRICSVCEQEAGSAADTLQKRITEGLCPVCGNARKIKSTTASGPPNNLPETAEHAFAVLSEARMILAEHQREWSKLTQTLAEERQNASAFAENARVYARQIRLLQKNLPAKDRAQIEQETAKLAAIRDEIENLRRERTEAENQISDLLSRLKDAIEQIRVTLEQRFNEIAKPYFAERVKLVYAPREARIGQQGMLFSFPAFEIEMTSGATQGDFIRRTAEQVSLSQRDYLDIIFRMAIIDVLGDRSGTLAIDGPEGSVDAVFAERAGDLFANFSFNSRKNVILACNIVEGGFIPHTLQNYARNPEARAIDLLKQAVPTAALLALRSKYEEKISAIYARTRIFA